MLLGCVDDTIDTGTAPIPPWQQDSDGDAYTADVDCDDNNTSVHPGGLELCDGLDQDCDGAIDEDARDAPRWYADEDADGYGDPYTVESACEAPAGWLDASGDCEDDDAAIFPGASERCNGEDDNCDGDVDEGVPLDPPLWYLDADGDGYGTIEASILVCLPPEGYVDNAGDCDDASAATHPDADEYCDELDDDCDGEVDEDAVDPSSFYADVDGDGWGDDADVVQSCTAPDGRVSEPGDCADADLTIFPGADEVCDTIDQDCDGVVDEDATDTTIFYPDADGDGHGEPSASLAACDEPAGWSSVADDCDDTDAAVSPSALEVCDTVDQDCDGTADEAAVDATTWYVDADSDGFGDASNTILACEQPESAVSDATDCDDLSADVSPAASEVCDAVDQDCDGAVDEDATDAPTWHLDADLDGWGGAASAVDCEAPSGYIAPDGDCDDADAAISPGATETCDGEDDDCDGVTDEDDALDATSWYADTDGDGFGDPAAPRAACSAPADYLADATDCDDTSDLINPGRPETCNDGVDNNCNDDHDGCVREGDQDLSSVYHARFGGTGPEDSVGSAVAFAGDPDADGVDDVLVGVEGYDEVWLYAGIPYGDLGPDDVSAVLLGDAGEGWGAALAGPGDTNGDGVDDVIAGAPEDAGRVVVIEGPWTTLLAMGYVDVELTPIGSDDALGTSVAGGDLDGDGLSDLIVGAPEADAGATDSGAVYVVYGGATGVVDLAYADGVFGGTTSFTAIGSAVASVGDVDGDGLGDLFVGAPSDRTAGTLAGAAYLVLGPATGTLTAAATFTGETAYDRAGSAIAAAGDTDADGLSDLIVGARYHDGGGADAGAAWLVRGPVSGARSLSTADAVVYGEDPGDQAGVSVAGVGDFDHDGFDDWAVGAWAAGAGYTGAAYVLYGPGPWDTDLSAADLHLSGSADAAAGTCLAGRPAGGDLTGDGVDDLIVGGPAAATGGAAWLLPGSGY